ncbi:MAG: hypothetical protein C4309_04980 [Chloroflexota bacterium]
MTEARATVPLEDIQQVVRQIVDRFHPQKVILFGSYARGEATRDSDVDFLVVMETEENPLHTAARISASIDHPFPLDILVIRPSDLGASFERGGVFAKEVMTKGVVLYEA